SKNQHRTCDRDPTQQQRTQHAGDDAHHVRTHCVRLTASDFCERAQTNATMAPPKHMPVPMRCTKSTARMVARVGRVSMLKRLRRPKAARTKATRRDSRRELMDYHLLNVVDEESERYVAPNGAMGAVLASWTSHQIKPPERRRHHVAV